MGFEPIYLNLTRIVNGGSPCKRLKISHILKIFLKVIK